MNDLKFKLHSGANFSEFCPECLLKKPKGCLSIPKNTCHYPLTNVRANYSAEFQVWSQGLSRIPDSLST
jgi:hypothetical protein